jgi:hypothetical protein
VPQMGHLFAPPLWPQLVGEIGQHAVWLGRVPA